MMPDSDPAVLEAQRRLLARKHKLVEQQEDAILENVLRRRRKYWTWFALLPGMLGVLGPYGGAYLLPIFSLPWVAFCTIRIVLTFRHWTLGKKIAAFFCIYVLLLAGVVPVFFVANIIAIFF